MRICGVPRISDLWARFIKDPQVSFSSNVSLVFASDLVPLHHPQLGFSRMARFAQRANSGSRFRTRPYLANISTAGDAKLDFWDRSGTTLEAEA